MSENISNIVQLKRVKTVKNYHDILLQINELIRLGHGANATELFRTINTKKIDNAIDRTLYANLARRLGVPQEALKLLHSFVRSSERSNTKATAGESIEYATALIRVGANTEALSLLKNIEHKSYPRVFLLEAFAHIATWDYDKAVVCLHKYLQSSSLSQYEVLVAKANLCEALGYLKHPDTATTIEQTLEEASKLNFKIICGHVSMTKAIQDIENKRWESATETLKQAEKYFGTSDILESFFIRKWQAILHFSIDKEHKLAGLNAIREEALNKWKHWETVRDCDFYEAVITKNEALFSHLYFGTPFISFRERLMKYWSSHEAMPKKYLWHVNTTGKALLTIELFSGDSIERKKLLKARKQIAVLLGIMTSDFYRPMRTAFIFSKLFPGEYFNQRSSPGRVRHVIFRTRKYLEKECIPLFIKEDSGWYKLYSTKPMIMVLSQSLVVSQFEAVAQKTDLLESILTKKARFSAQDACEALKLPRRSINRLLSQAVENGLIVRVGVGKSITYSWVVESPELPKAA